MSNEKQIEERLELRTLSTTPLEIGMTTLRNAMKKEIPRLILLKSLLPMPLLAQATTSRARGNGHGNTIQLAILKDILFVLCVLVAD